MILIYHQFIRKRSSRWYFIAVSGLLLGAVLCIAVSNAISSQTSLRLSPLAIEVSSHAPTGEVLCSILPLRNKLSSDVLDLKIVVGCGCTSLPAYPRSIRHGDSYFVPLAITVKSSGPNELDQKLLLEYRVELDGETVPCSEMDQFVLAKKEDGSSFNGSGE